MDELNEKSVIQKDTDGSGEHDAVTNAARAAYQDPQKEIFCEPRNLAESLKYILGPVALNCTIKYFFSKSEK